MISDKMKKLVENNSVIREMFEEGRILKEKYGEENVFDFSLGNPSVDVPKEVNDAIYSILKEEEQNLVHGYMSNEGYKDVRESISNSLNKRFGTSFSYNNFIMTSGAASALNITLKSILNKDEEVIVFAPYFSEYKCYIENYDVKVVEISPNFENDFIPNIEELEKKINKATRAVIINTPNNPTGIVYSKDVICDISKVLSKKEKELGREIFLISDEPYRELVYDGKEVPFISKYYKNTIICYSYSKTLSIPGERIGYVLVPDEVDDSKNLIQAITIANRVSGIVNAPSLIQKVISKCVDIKCDVSSYDKNRRYLYDNLVRLGFECVKPEGAFYIFVKAPLGDDKEFCIRAKKYNLLFVPATSFGCKGYVRIAYCTKFETIKNSINSFSKLAKEYNLQEK